MLRRSRLSQGLGTSNVQVIYRSNCKILFSLYFLLLQDYMGSKDKISCSWCNIPEISVSLLLPALNNSISFRQKGCEEKKLRTLKFSPNWSEIQRFQRILGNMVNHWSMNLGSVERSSLLHVSYRLCGGILVTYTGGGRFE